MKSAFDLFISVRLPPNTIAGETSNATGFS